MSYELLNTADIPVTGDAQDDTYRTQREETPKTGSKMRVDTCCGKFALLLHGFTCRNRYGRESHENEEKKCAHTKTPSGGGRTVRARVSST
jgi:hypothetical protein